MLGLWASLDRSKLSTKFFRLLEGEMLFSDVVDSPVPAVGEHVNGSEWVRDGFAVL